MISSHDSTDNEPTATGIGDRSASDSSVSCMAHDDDAYEKLSQQVGLWHQLAGTVSHVAGYGIAYITYAAYVTISYSIC